MLLRKALAVLAMLGGAASATACLRSESPPGAWPCKTQADCQSDQVCFGSEQHAHGTCRSPDYCELDSECGTLGRCRNNVCSSVECTAAVQEACAPYHCDASTNACVSTCLRSDDCNSGYVCKGRACVISQCQGAADCEPGFGCRDGLCDNTCSSRYDCPRNYVCETGQCVVEPQVNSAPCSADQECTSQHCCAQPTPNQRACQATCNLLALGQACSWDDVCSTQRCAGQVCVDCVGDECRAKVCGERVCGTVQSVDCGTCPSDRYCDGAGQCSDPCQDVACGPSRVAIADCGSCGEGSYCESTARVCIEACVDMACGTDHDIFCGKCDGEQYCAEHQCEPWSQCAPGSEVTTEPSPTQDRTCAACLDNYSSTANASECSEWTQCLGVEKKPGTLTTDRVCYGGFNRDYGSAVRDEEAWALTLLPGSDLILGGWKDREENQQYPNIDETGFLRRIDTTTGDIEWERNFGTSSLNRVTSLAVGAGDFVYAAGYAYSDVGAGHAGQGDAFLMKFHASNGEVAWVKGFGTASFDLANAVAVAPDGNVFMAGFTSGALAGPRVATGNGSDTFAYKLSGSDGSVIWKTQFGPGSGWGVAVDPSGDAFVVGSAKVGINHEGGGQFTVRKLKGTTGAELWTSRFGSNGNYWAKTAVCDAEGNVFVGGGSGTSAIVMKLQGSDGEELWRYDSQVLAYEPNVALANNGNVLAAGETFSDLEGEGESLSSYVLELSRDEGTLEWIEQYRVHGAEEAKDVRMDADENIWVCGRRDLDDYGAAYVAKIIRE